VKTDLTPFFRRDQYDLGPRTSGEDVGRYYGVIKPNDDFAGIKGFGIAFITDPLTWLMAGEFASTVKASREASALLKVEKLEVAAAQVAEELAGPPNIRLALSQGPKSALDSAATGSHGGLTSRQLRIGSLADQAKFLSENVPGLTQEQALSLLTAAQQRGSSVVIGGSRIRGNFRPDSDLDVGYGNLSKAQAQKINEKVSDLGPLKIDRTPIVPGHESKSVPKISSPEEFFQRGGVRGPGDPRAGEPYLPSGSITVTPQGDVIIIPPGANPS
jgi:hypothetical protein